MCDPSNPAPELQAQSIIFFFEFWTRMEVSRVEMGWGDFWSEWWFWGWRSSLELVNGAWVHSERERKRTEKTRNGVKMLNSSLSVGIYSLGSNCKVMKIEGLNCKVWDWCRGSANKFWSKLRVFWVKPDSDFSWSDLLSSESVHTGSFSSGPV